jgi:Protein of unknown function (DUF3551)
MRPLLRSTIASILVRALAHAAISAPAQAHTYEYSRRDAESFAQSCSFDTLAQCQAMSSGRGGDCYPDPFLGDAIGARADAPIHIPARAAPRKSN